MSKKGADNKRHLSKKYFLSIRLLHLVSGSVNKDFISMKARSQSSKPKSLSLLKLHRITQDIQYQEQKVLLIFEN